jgi:beta-1,4-mannooligosaccharide/beta-1,4-mannosyl-N-acetylglucosamine phosphorylase
VATHFRSVNIYQAGAVLLDLEEPTRVLARTRDNILEPRETWELTGQVPNVVFPGGLTVDLLDDEGFAPDEATVRIYYGAADTAVGLAQTTIGELVAACGSASGKESRF